MIRASSEVLEFHADLERDGQDQDPAGVIDPRTFHLFDDGPQRLLYSVETGELLEVTQQLAELIERCSEAPLSEVDGHYLLSEDSWSPGAAEALLRPLIERGFFHYRELDREQQSSFLDQLWKHNPRRLQLLMAQMCNLKCLYCYEEQNGSNARKRLMTFEMAKTSVDYLVERAGTRRQLQITFFGGEPLLNKKVMYQVVEYCEKVGEEQNKEFVFELITNGSLLTPDVTDYLVEKRFLLMISLDGYREMNNFNRPSVNGSDLYDTILENARYANHAYRESGIGIPVKVRANLTHEHHDLARTVEFLEGQGFTTIGVASVDDLPWSEVNLHACTEQDLDEIAEQRRAFRAQGIEDLIRNRRPRPFARKLAREALREIQKSFVTRGLRCGVGRNTNIVDTDGNIYPCHRYGDMTEYILGNVEQGTLDESRMRSYYEAVNQAASTKCTSCWARNVCGGPCAWEVSSPQGDIIEPREEHCRRIRDGMEANLILRRKLLNEAPHLLPESERASTGCTSCG